MSMVVVDMVSSFIISDLFRARSVLMAGGSPHCIRNLGWAMQRPFQDMSMLVVDMMSSFIILSLVRVRSVIHDWREPALRIG